MSKEGNTLELIREHAGKMSYKEIAKLAKVVPGRILCVASENRISVRIPTYATPKAMRYFRVPPGLEKRVADDINTIMERHELDFQADAILLALHEIAQEIRTNKAANEA